MLEGLLAEALTQSKQFGLKAACWGKEDEGEICDWTYWNFEVGSGTKQVRGEMFADCACKQADKERGRKTRDV